MPIWYLLPIADNHPSIVDPSIHLLLHPSISTHTPNPPRSPSLPVRKNLFPNYLSPGRWSSGVETWGWTPLSHAAPSHSGARASPPRCCSPGTTPASPSRRFYFGAGLWGCSPAPSCYFCWIAVRGGGKKQLEEWLRGMDDTDSLFFSEAYCSISG